MHAVLTVDLLTTERRLSVRWDVCTGMDKVTELRASPGDRSTLVPQPRWGQGPANVCSSASMKSIMPPLSLCRLPYTVPHKRKTELPLLKSLVGRLRDHLKLARHHYDLHLQTITCQKSAPPRGVSLILLSLASYTHSLGREGQ